MDEQDIKPIRSRFTPSRSRGVLSLLVFATMAATAGLIGIVHLDLAPDNAMLAAIAAFSIAAALQSMLGRARHVRVLEADIAELREEIAQLKPAAAAPHIAARMAAAMPRAETRQPNAASAPPTAGAAATSVTRQVRDVAASLQASRSPAPVDGTAEKAAPAGATPPKDDVPAWTMRPGQPRLDSEPPVTTKIVPSRPPIQSHAAPTDAPATEPATQPMQAPTQAPEPAHVATAEPIVATDHPAADAPIAVTARAPAPPQSPAIADPPPSAAAALQSRWPIATPAPSNSPLDLQAMQSLVEQLADQLAQPTDAAAAGSAKGPRRAAATPDRVVLPPPPATPGLQPVARRAAAPLGRLALLSEAVEANRMDVLLEPILGLDDRKARHFEMSVRFVGNAGESLEPGDFAAQAAGTGLLARIDAAKLGHAAEIAGRLRRRGSQASLFSNIAGESLADDNFLGAFADTLEAEDDIGTKLILTFAQNDARHFTEAHWHSMSVMSEIGLRFALDHVTDLDMDFSRLKQHGFDFIKLDAPVFLSGLAAPGGLIPAADICRHLSSLGLALIVGGIVDERALARILGFGAILGQGTLFGGARSVEVDKARRAA